MLGFRIKEHGYSAWKLKTNTEESERPTSMERAGSLFRN